MTPHPHADLLRAIADGEQIQINYACGWEDVEGRMALLEIATGHANNVRIAPAKREVRRWKVWIDGDDISTVVTHGGRECITVQEILEATDEQ